MHIYVRTYAALGFSTQVCFALFIAKFKVLFGAAQISAKMYSNSGITGMR